MAGLTLTPDGGSPIDVPVAVDGGFAVPFAGTMILERRWDGSAASITIQNDTASLEEHEVRTTALSEADLLALKEALTGLGTVTASGTLFPGGPFTCRVEGVRREIGTLRDQERLQFRLREVGP